MALSVHSTPRVVLRSNQHTVSLAFRSVRSASEYLFRLEGRKAILCVEGKLFVLIVSYDYSNHKMSKLKIAGTLCEILKKKEKKKWFEPGKYE